MLWMAGCTCSGAVRGYPARPGCRTVDVLGPAIGESELPGTHPFWSMWCVGYALGRVAHLLGHMWLRVGAKTMLCRVPLVRGW